MDEDALRWPMMGGTYFGVALVDFLGGVMDFGTVDGFGDLVDFGTRECEGLDSNRSFPVMSTLSIVLVALEIFRHMIDRIG